MKRYILAGLCGAAAMLAGLILCANISIALEQKASPQPQAQQEAYRHVDYVSAISPEACFLCGDQDGSLTAHCQKQDNVAILDLNTFTFLLPEVNRYDPDGTPVTTEAGYIRTDTMKTESGSVVSYTDPDRGYSLVQITGAAYGIDRGSVEKQLCQSCLDSVNGACFDDTAPAALAVVDLAEGTLRPLVRPITGFQMGNFYVDCEFQDSGKISLLIFYCPNRYKQ